MKRSQDTGEIYLISLDTFMLMAVLGITLGILFIVLNPTAGLSTRLFTKDADIIDSISISDFTKLRDKLDVYSDIKQINQKVNDLSEGEYYRYIYNSTTPINSYQLKQVRKINGILTELVINCFVTKEKVDFSISYLNENFDYFEWDSVKTTNNEFILRQIRNWDTVADIIILEE
ncbi:MAG: hypothetical protein ISR90_05855 [Candidatus Marinimicrobia bacterium]|nr:hypothetical protein [Candidatus Neomarinimicrobiota bacterium]MBL7023558.1 hypothetical protein [Candidatus Neomarinimicrobiota bacterium]